MKDLRRLFREYSHAPANEHCANPKCRGERGACPPGFTGRSLRIERPQGRHPLQAVDSLLKEMDK